jgi:hypothetical protein
MDASNSPVRCWTRLLVHHYHFTPVLQSLKPLVMLEEVEAIILGHVQQDNGISGVIKMGSIAADQAESGL